MKFACLISDGFEDAEAILTVDLLKRAGIIIDYVSVFNAKKVKGAYNTTVIADVMMKDITENDYDGILIPGGRHSFIINKEKSVQDLVKSFYEQDKWMMSLCAGPTVFGAMGILDEKKYISFPGTENLMHNAKRVNKQVVKDGKFITAIALGAGFEFAFEIIETVLGKEALDTVKQRIYYKD